ncbi:HDOD domain-containing protein [Pelagicoccus sp. NFK12]|uniref:HDOD domain-containing protein n=1 Tax=Pelagicoccus enzymogenes TaxID=2773457 RepID=A0A927F5U8_9BACT|nr:HDOD domain-containing protein [Pelagicoccus enzymogenes]MBD5778241.1 HDOD domain-containing protein [Pelagicoccus enzymogenes]MDQ8200909.1 HDOD domain-containing protein [Pelagicoccus enzymogenes]
MSSKPNEKINLELLIEHAASLPTSPRIYTRLNQLLNNEDASLDYISSLVKMDPGLAAQVLRVTNSAAYAGTIKVNEIGTAISRIGFNELRSILKMVVEKEAFYQALPVYGETATAFADRSLEVAIISEVIANRAGFETNAPYITGLLHQVGKLAINLYLERIEKAFDITEHLEERPLIEVEQELLGLSHYRVGAEVLNNWKFETTIWQPIKNQNSPLHAHSHLRETSILSLAIWFADQLGGYDPDATTPEHIKRACKELGLDALDLTSLLDDSRFEINDRKNQLAMLL